MGAFSLIVVINLLNRSVNEINRICCLRFSGESVACYSADSVYDSADECRFPREFLNSLTLPGVPEHCLVLKIGMPVIFLRNIIPREGLCNGVRLIVKNIIDK